MQVAGKSIQVCTDLTSTSKFPSVPTVGVIVTEQCRLTIAHTALHQANDNDKFRMRELLLSFSCNSKNQHESF